MNECVCGGVESSSPCHGEGRGFESRQTRWNGTVRKLEKRRDQPTSCRSVPETFVNLRVRLPPLPLDIRVGWALACPSGCNPPASAVQVQLLPDALMEGETFGPFVYRFRTPASHAGKAGSIPARVTLENLMNTTKWCNW